MSKATITMSIVGPLLCAGLVACGDTDASRAIAPPPPSTTGCSLTREQRTALTELDSVDGYEYVDYGVADAAWREDSTAIVITLPSGDEMKIPACAYDEAKALLP